MEAILQTPSGDNIMMLDIVRGPKKRQLLEALSPHQPKKLSKQHLVTFRVKFNNKEIRLRLYVEGYRYDPYDANTNAIIANGRLIKSDERAKIFCSQVQFRYDCTCDSGKIRLVQSAA